MSEFPKIGMIPSSEIGAGEVALSVGCKGAKVVKSSEECCVFETNDHYVKIREFQEFDPCVHFESLVNETLSEVIRSFGIEWDFSVVKNCNGRHYYVWKSEKLEVFDPTTSSLQAAFTESSKIIDKVERNLGFPSLTAQVKQQMNVESVARICLARNSEIALDDFAKKGEVVVPLGNSGMFISIVDCRDQWKYEIRNSIIKVTLPEGAFYFASKHSFDGGRGFAGMLYHPTPEWWLFPAELYDLQEIGQSLNKDVQELFSDNMSVLFSKNRKPLRTCLDFARDDYIKLESSLTSSDSPNILKG